MRLAIRHLDRHWLSALIAAAVLLACASLAGGRQGRTVYYQVTYADGSSRDLSAPPASNQGVTRVLRIARVEQGAKGYEILSTGPQPLTLVSRGQTYRTDLIWNGKAWAAPADEPDAAIVVESSAPGRAPEGRLRAEAEKLKSALIDLAAQLLESDKKLAAAEKSLGKQEAAAVVAAREQLRECLVRVLDGARRLSAPAAEVPEPPAAPSGEVTTPKAAAPAQGAGGVGKPIENVAVLPHRVQVWKLPAAEGERAYRLSIAHPEAGAAGAFYYVAYADTTGNGQPDKLLARSPLAVADAPGQWTQWRFTTAEKNVFVGKAWVRPDAVHYHSEAIRVADGWRDLSTRAYVAIDAWGMPTRPWGPCYGNIRVWTEGP